MFGQTFDLSDVPRIAVLAVLEILLSADNAIVLGLIASRLSPQLRNRALLIGFTSAWIFRLTALLGIAFLLEYAWLQFFGGMYLLYLAVHHFIKKRKKDNPLISSPTISFWQTVLMIELYDLVFATDSLIAGVAFIGTSEATIHPKLWIVYMGGMIGVASIRYAAHIFSSIFPLFPFLETSAYVMIAWIGLKLGMGALSLSPPYFDFVFWSVLILLFLVGLRKGV